ncbi:MAG: hypothetical protein OQL09_00965 [Gammaproteobacteria bacterium]|nr:hypothetical protein [Gammaproteobacteria bacterium]
MLSMILKASTKEISVFMVALFISIAVISFSNLYWLSVEEDKQRADRELSTIRAKFNDALSRKKILETFEQQYTDLKAGGFIGNEDRVEWLDGLDSVIKDNHIPKVKYQINKQLAYTVPVFKAAYPEIDLFMSTMGMHMDLLHEADLIVLFNKMDKKVKGSFDITECKIQKNSNAKGSILESNSSSNINADCKIDWITVKQANEQEDA